MLPVGLDLSPPKNDDVLLLAVRVNLRVAGLLVHVPVPLIPAVPLPTAL